MRGTLALLTLAASGLSTACDSIAVDSLANAVGACEIGVEESPGTCAVHVGTMGTLCTRDPQTGEGLS